MKKIHFPQSGREKIKLLIIAVFILLAGGYFIMKLREGISKLELPLLEKSKGIIEKIDYGNKIR